jgi:hypothetical protein
MPEDFTGFLKKIYAAFNARKIDEALALMDKNVQWSNSWEGGIANGHEGVRDYWSRQWKELNPVVEPAEFEDLEDGKIEVKAHQLVKDADNNILFNGFIKHIYTIENGLVKRMELEPFL